MGYLPRGLLVLAGAWVHVHGDLHSFVYQMVRP